MPASAARSSQTVNRRTTHTTRMVTVSGDTPAVTEKGNGVRRKQRHNICFRTEHQPAVRPVRLFKAIQRHGSLAPHPAPQQAEACTPIAQPLKNPVPDRNPGQNAAADPPLSTEVTAPTECNNTHACMGISAGPIHSWTTSCRTPCPSRGISAPPRPAAERYGAAPPAPVCAVPSPHPSPHVATCITAAAPPWSSLPRLQAGSKHPSHGPRPPSPRHVHDKRLARLEVVCAALVVLHGQAAGRHGGHAAVHPHTLNVVEHLRPGGRAGQWRGARKSLHGEDAWRAQDARDTVRLRGSRPRRKPRQLVWARSRAHAHRCRPMQTIDHDSWGRGCPKALHSPVVPTRAPNRRATLHRPLPQPLRSPPPAVPRPPGP